MTLMGGASVVERFGPAQPRGYIASNIAIEEVDGSQVAAAVAAEAVRGRQQVPVVVEDGSGAAVAAVVVRGSLRMAAVGFGDGSPAAGLGRALGARRPHCAVAAVVVEAARCRRLLAVAVAVEEANGSLLVAVAVEMAVVAAEAARCKLMVSEVAVEFVCPHVDGLISLPSSQPHRNLAADS